MEKVKKGNECLGAKNRRKTREWFDEESNKTKRKIQNHENSRFSENEFSTL